MRKRVQRIVIDLLPEVVEVRSQAKTARGTPYTVGHAAIPHKRGDKVEVKWAVK